MFPNLQDRKIHHRNFIVFQALALCLVFVGIYIMPTKAQSQEYFNTKITPKEKAIFAFFRAAKVAPEYENWISSTMKYKVLDDTKKKDYLIKEMLRLGRGYGLYDMNTHVLELKAPVVVRYHPAKSNGEQSHLKFRFYNLEQTNIPTFDFHFGNNTVSLIIENLNVFSNLVLSPEQDQAIRTKIPYETDEFDASLIIHTKVYNADYEHPVEEDKKWRKWLMVGKIAYVKCEVDSFYTQQKHILWDYVAPWYEEQFRVKNMPEEEKYPHPYELFK